MSGRHKLKEYPSLCSECHTRPVSYKGSSRCVICIQYGAVYKSFRTPILCSKCGTEIRRKTTENKIGRLCQRCRCSTEAYRYYTYGLTPQEYNDLYETQRGCCAICGTSETEGYPQTNLEVDHDHETGKVRGLLCHPCNWGIGALLDDYQTVTNAAAYLLKYKE